MCTGSLSGKKVRPHCAHGTKALGGGPGAAAAFGSLPSLSGGAAEAVPPNSVTVSRMPDEARTTDLQLRWCTGSLSGRKVRPHAHGTRPAPPPSPLSTTPPPAMPPPPPPPAVLFLPPARMSRGPTLGAAPALGAVSALSVVSALSRAFSLAAAARALAAPPVEIVLSPWVSSRHVSKARTSTPRLLSTSRPWISSVDASRP
mmetsp:Transcript_28112/g.59073  ORF Transcript_28112/g.59073 Transcript_28112/m.59073 type:complete len:202 (+) Transcript_28112:471-1076(+)